MGLKDLGNLVYGSLFGGTVVPPQHKKSDGSWVETGENDPLPTQLTGSYERLSAEPKPTGADGVKDGNTLMIVDTGQVFKYYKGQWYEL